MRSVDPDSWTSLICTQNVEVWFHCYCCSRPRAAAPRARRCRRGPRGSTAAALACAAPGGRSCTRRGPRGDRGHFQGPPI